MKSLPSITVPIIVDHKILHQNLLDIFKGKKSIIFGVPGAFTSTCSDVHLPGYYSYYNSFQAKGYEDIYCLSVNDPFVMRSWLLGYNEKNKIKGIADGNAEISKSLNLCVDKSSSFMGIRCLRFAMIIINGIIEKNYVEKPNILDVSSAENILSKI